MPVALVAADAWTGFGAGLPATLEGLLRGSTAIAPATAEEEAFGAAGAARLGPLADAPSPEGPTRVVTPHGRVLERVVRVAHDAAGGSAVARERVGLFVALGMVDSDPEALAPAIVASRGEGGVFDLARFFGGGFRAIHPHWPLQMLNNVAVGQLAADLDARGDHLVLAAEADAGARAAAAALEAVAGGEADLALAAGAAEAVGPAAFLRARLRGQPGFVPGEGGAALALADEAAARGRGLAPLGRLAGAGFAFGASDLGPGPSAEALERAARTALEAAGATPEQVGLLVVEGAGAEEAQARRALLGRRPEVAVVAPSVAVGHLGPAAPLLAVALAAAALARGVAPSTAGGRPRPLDKGARALVWAQGSGGGAAALVVEGAS